MTETEQQLDELQRRYERLATDFAELQKTVNNNAIILDTAITRTGRLERTSGQLEIKTGLRKPKKRQELITSRRYPPHEI